jgi:hypothetical protein
VQAFGSRGAAAQQADAAFIETDRCQAEPGHACDALRIHVHPNVSTPANQSLTDCFGLHFTVFSELHTSWSKRTYSMVLLLRRFYRTRSKLCAWKPALRAAFKAKQVQCRQWFPCI